MRFDYQSPIAAYEIRRWRRLGIVTLTLIGLSCIILALILGDEAPQRSIEAIALPGEVEQPALELSGKFAQLEDPVVDKETVKDVKVKPGDTLSRIFNKVGIPHHTLHEMMTSSPKAKQLSSIKPGQLLQFVFDANDEFKEIKVPLTATKTLHVRNSENGFKYYFEEKQLTKRLAFSQNTIKDSLYSAAQSAGLDDKLIMQMADIFGWDIDFSLDIRENDSFRVIYEEEYLDEEKVDSGKILAVEFTNQGRAYKAVRYTDDEGRTGYFTPEGFSLQKAFLRTPVKFSRISSHFSKGRNHPVLHRIRAHKGVDYAAPHGTPVKASGDGRITFVGTKGGYGKSIEIQHGRKYSTFYAHLSRFGKNIRHGCSVKQGQIIGYVGRTGLATGDHLHYEFRINGVHRNPLTVKLPRSLPISDKQRKKFTYHAKNMLDLLDSHETASLSRIANNG